MYAHLLHRLDAEKCPLTSLTDKEPLKRAECVLEQAKAIGCPVTLTPNDLISVRIVVYNNRQFMPHWKTNAQYYTIGE